ncbi:MAG: DNA primase large subunit PriL [Candidatus Bathyarchaeota archaeon]|nr:DNA primase large subunit PriL [Candidatus Bathyarchaeota archaeon]
MVIARSDLAKYPFLQDAAEEVKKEDLDIGNLERDDYERILRRAVERIKGALESDQSVVEYREREDLIEIPSYPVAILLVAASGSDYVKRRYALKEAKRAYELLQKENTEKILEIAGVFDWKVRSPKETISGRRFDFALHFTDFLRNAKPFHAKEWKLVNKVVRNGKVYLRRREAARLLQEEIRRRIVERLSSDVRSMLPEGLLELVDRFKQEYAGRIEKAQFPAFPRDVVNEAFPPCIALLYDAAKTGRHLSHLGRFTLTSFLVTIGMKTGDVVELFRTSSDFNERMTRYQVEHIAGDRGSRTKYRPPTCDTLRTHGLCPGVGDSCKTVRHPLSYYGRKTRTLKKEVPVS